MTHARRPRSPGATHLQRERTRIAQEAARLISEHGIRDYRRAIAKAAARLGCSDLRALPQPQELDAALRAHQRLFHATSQPRLLRERREAALAAMEFLRAFDPRLVGAVLDGTADAHSAVCLHVFSDDGDAVGSFLRDHGIPFLTRSRRVRLGHGPPRDCPLLEFDADGVPFMLTVLPAGSLHQPPQGDADVRPLQRATIARLRALLAEERTMPGIAGDPGH